MPFEGICLTDTFQMYESDDLISHYMPDNSERRKRQKATDIRVIVGNPPYSAGQGSDNDEAANVRYTGLDNRIQQTYAARSTGNPRSLYDSYIRAIRWASDRIGSDGVLAYVTNAGWVEGKAADGLRACLAEEFTDLYIFHLRGNQRTSGEQSRREGGKIFGSGSRAPIAISVFVKSEKRAERGNIYFHDIGDYLDQKQKLSIVRDFGSIQGVAAADGWKSISPNEHSDWLNQRDKSFDAFIKMGDKKDKSSTHLFAGYSAGVKTNRDAWAYNFSRADLLKNMSAMIRFYHACLASPNRADVNDEKKISWSWVLRERFKKGRSEEFREDRVRRSIYRPFCKTHLYYDPFFNENRYQTPSIFPDAGQSNLAIYMTGPSAPAFSAILVDSVPCLDLASKGQCFPLTLYGEASVDDEDEDLFSGNESAPTVRRRDGITDAGLKHFQDAYPGETITKEDLFYYVYGLLHSEDYRAKYADNLSKELPRIPRVKTAADFWAFSRAGRTLGDLHVNYETVEPYPVTIKQGDLRLADIKNPQAFYRVTKWAFGKSGKEKDKTTVIYNANITMQDVPMEAYDYVVNGKPALEWVMERQVVKIDKDSGIENDANRYANETMNNPAYPLELFQRVITVSLRTMEIVRSLPKLEVM